MFGIFASPQKKLRKLAGNWLELSDKVRNYRRDVMQPAEIAELQSKAATVRGLLREQADSSKLKLSLEALEETLRRHGGKVYPKSSLVENVEFFLVAAIVILGIRTYFIQPFKIPTNSMWPSYHGMTPEVFRQTGDEPNVAQRALRFLMLGARSRRIDAPASGEVEFTYGGGEGRGIISNRVVNGRSWLVLPTKLKEYTLFVGGAPVSFTVPLDFDFDWALREAFFPGEPNLEVALEKLNARGQSQIRTVSIAGRPQNLRFFKTGRIVQSGERILSFDILTGDQLFVDRMSYHFIQPPIGSGFVFRTGNIPGIRDTHGDQYYIKRLVGGPGDVIEIREGTLGARGNNSAIAAVAPNDRAGVLMRNGKPIEGAKAFEKNNERDGLYAGYMPYGELALGRQLTVPKGSFFALGDNSRNSLDGRYWGFVPSRDVVGRPLWIYYPFTSRWGPAR
ncbi:MAG: signal peptidase I [Opitutaceae bacterium]|nr:signal peptidase I [Opitutaceae bacterium]